MSYNYLPLDKKQLHFDQVKNLLDFDQLVSITFDAHEQILKCRDYLDEKLRKGDLMDGINVYQNKKIEAEQIAEFQHDLLRNNANPSGAEVPLDIVKLMLMLKIKSLGYGLSGVQIETVKRLMEMYNNGMFSIVYSEVLLDDKLVLSQMALPLIGLGNVYFKGEKMIAAHALELLNLQPIKLTSKEGLALINGTQFTTAYGLYHLKNVEQLLLEFDKSIVGFALAMDAFDAALQVFMKEANSVTDSLLIFPDKDVIMDNGDSSNQHLLVALQLVDTAIVKLYEGSKPS